MRKYILLLLIFIPISIYAQHFNYLSNYSDLSKYKTIDSAYMKCAYKLTYLKDSLKPQDQSFDLQILLIGKNISGYYSQYAVDYNHFVVDYLKKKYDAYPKIKQTGAWSYHLYKNYPQGKETVADVASMLRSSFIYEEDMPSLDWQIVNEKQTILSYTCQKATVSFRGRNFIAWFATDIPIPNGPWKFGGLPGLILKLSDSKNQFVYECQGLERLKQKEPIQFYLIDYTKTTRKDLAKAYLLFHTNLAAFFGSNKVTSTFGRPMTMDEAAELLKIPYNPIELE